MKTQATDRGRSAVLLGLSLLLVVASGPALAGSGKSASKSRLSGLLAERAKAGGVEMVDVIVTFENQPGPAENAVLDALGAKSNRAYANLPMVAVRVPARALEAVSKSRDSEVEAASASSRTAANVPPIGTYEDIYFNGGGFRVAVLDSGVGVHADIPVAMQKGFIGTLNSRSDPYGHGTHVAGIISGYGTASYCAHWGLAWNAPIVSLRVLDGQGKGSVSAVLAAIDWLIANRVAQNVRVANFSLGKAIEESAASDPLVLAVERLWDAGVVVLCSAGNYGRDGYGTVTSPGNSRKVITVGSWTDNGTGTNYTDDMLSSFSSMGPTLYDHFLKPDLVAPGNRIVATMSSNSKLMVDLPTRVASCGTLACQAPFFELSGTSMAAPMVGSTGDPHEVGAGLLDVKAALYATGFAAAAPSPKLGRSADRSVIYIDDVAVTWGSGWSSAILWSDTYVVPDAALWPD